MSSRTSTLRDGFAVLAVGIRREPWVFTLSTLGSVLFSQHLISVEVAGTLLLAALVGAVSIAIHGKRRLETQVEEALRHDVDGTEAPR